VKQPYKALNVLSPQKKKPGAAQTAMSNNTVDEPQLNTESSAATMGPEALQKMSAVDQKRLFSNANSPELMDAGALSLNENQ